MKNEIKNRKKRFWATVLTLLLLLNQIPPILGGAAEAYTVDTVYTYQVLKPGDTISNDAETSCGIYYYDVGENGARLSSADITKDSPHEVPEYSGDVSDGFRFAGWNIYSVGYVSGGGVESIYLQAVISIDGTEIGDSLYDSTLNAGTVIYSETDTYTVTYYDQDGTTLTGGRDIAANTAYEVLAYPKTEPTGYQFVGWTVTSVYASGGTGSLELTAQLAKRQFTITFDADGGSSVAPITADYGTAVTPPENPTKTGYTFDGWDPEIPTTMPADNVTIKAKWIINQYTIKFVNEDGTELQSSKFDYGQIPVYSGQTPAKAATAEYTYTFAGWTPEVVAVTGEAAYMAAYAQTANAYTITFETSGGSTVAPITQAYGTAVTAPADPTRTGYSFVNWNPEIPATMPAEDMTILARWTVNAYTITFDTDGGSTVDAITQDYGTAVTTPANPTKTGYTFAGWDPEIPATMPAENITITAQWTADRYSISYHLNGGTNGNNPSTYAYGTGVSSLADAVKPGYNFAGWYENPDFSGEEVTSIAADRKENVTLYAKFELGTIEAGTYSLTAGVEYRLGNVTRVSGDSSVYVSGSAFYVPTSGTYTFS